MMNQAMLAAKLQPSGLRVRMKKPPLSQLLGGNPLDPEGAGGDDELLKMLKVTRGQ